MALIKCPECGKQISEKADKCPHCGLPSQYFNIQKTAKSNELSEKDYKNLPNVVISFDSDYAMLFSPNHYITHREKTRLHDTYDRYYKPFLNKLIFQYVCNNAITFRIDIDGFKSFLRKMHELDDAIKAHNSEYVERTLEQEKDYFDNILKDIDPNIKLDDEQRRAVITDDDYYLLVAGAGACETTTMAAKFE
jgi:DNA helicase-4